MDARATVVAEVWNFEHSIGYEVVDCFLFIAEQVRELLALWYSFHSYFVKGWPWVAWVGAVARFVVGN